MVRNSLSLSLREATTVTVLFRPHNNSPVKLSFDFCHFLKAFLSFSTVVNLSSADFALTRVLLSVGFPTIHFLLRSFRPMVCPWPFMARLDSSSPTAALLPETEKAGRSFAQVLSGGSSGDTSLPKLPPKVVMGASVRIKISQAAYELGLAACRFNLHGRLTLHKGDSPLTTQALKLKLNNFWPQLSNWNLIPLGKGFFELNFNSIEDMKQVWASGAVNLKPGFMRFSCWTKDFIPKVQAQTHARVWVRLMQLPLEYWGKQTIFEIASGLGTPLTIDESTLNKRFGLYARVLIDVDLQEKLFESVIVEREGHALTVMIQYEKVPTFCANCKTIGHSIHSCSKLHADSNVQTTRSTNNVNQKFQSKPAASYKNNAKFVPKVAAANVSTTAHNIAVGHQPDNLDIHEAAFVSADDFEEGEVSAPENNDLEIINTLHPAISQNPTTGNNSNLNLHNAFELLASGSEHVTGEALPLDEEFTPTTLDMFIDKSSNVEANPLGMEILTQSTNKEASGKCSSTPLLESVKGRQQFPITDPTSLVQGSNIGRMTFPNATVVSFGTTTDPTVDDSITMQPIISPITTYDEILGQDKRKLQCTTGPKNTNAACLKDGKVLRKLWGDVDTDSTLEPEDMEVFPPAADMFLTTPLEMGKFTKPGRKSRKHKSPNGKGSGGITSSCELIERMSYFGISSNLVLYLTRKLHEGTVKSSNNVTNWAGTVKILPVIGAYIADAYLGRYWTFVVSTGIYFLGMCLLTLTVSLPMLRPPPCAQGIADKDCQKASSLQIGIFFFALYIIAAGTGGTKPNISTIGADQFDEFEPKERSQKLSFYNWWVFYILIGTISAQTILVYIQDNVGFALGYGIPTVLLVVSILVFVLGTPLYRHRLPSGSPLTRMVQVFVAAMRKWKLNVPIDSKELHEVSIEEYTSKGRYRINHSSSLRFLDKAAVKTGQTSPWMLCTVTQIEETKQMTKMLPVLITTCIPSTIISQTTTLFIRQGTTLDRGMGAHFKIPPACLIAFVNIFMLISVVIYDRIFVPVIRHYTKNSRGITMLQRLGIGLVMHVIVMIVACLIERKRLSVAREHNLLGPIDTIPLTIFILVPQFALMGIADTFVDIAKLEFFYDQAPESI